MTPGLKGRRRRKCLPCEAGVKNSICRKRNVLYESTCKECLGEGDDFTYVGESSRSVYERAFNHLEDYRSKHEDSHTWSHALSHHQGRMDLEFKFVIVKIFQKVLTRQISEALRTRQRGEDLILNKKRVFNRCAVPELAVKFNLMY